MKNTKFNQKFLLGRLDNENIYLSAPSWDCGWYWGFGYLGNKNCHYHIDGLMKDKNLYDGLIDHFGNSLKVRKSDLWTFCELFKTFYSLKETAEVLGRGGSHYTSNPCKDIIINTDEVERINNVVLPAIFDAIFDVLERNSQNDKMFKELVKLNNEGDTDKVVKFMFDYKIHTDDIKDINGITDHDYSIIHSAYWTLKHKK